MQRNIWGRISITRHDYSCVEYKKYRASVGGIICACTFVKSVMKQGSSEAQRVGSLVRPARRHAPSPTAEAVRARAPFASAETSAAEDVEDDVEYGDDDL